MFKLKHLLVLTENTGIFKLNRKFVTNDNITKKIDTNLIDSSDNDVFKLMKRVVKIKEDFISETEEESLLREVEPIMKKKRYEFDHWDNVIR